MRKWEIKQKADMPETLEMYIYNDVEGTYYDWWTDEKVTPETSSEYFRQELEAHANAKEINIYINSLGGSVLEGVAIYNQLKRHPAKKTVYVDGFACSVASVIAMAGDKVIMPKNTVMMLHNAWTHTSGNAKQLRKQADDLENMDKAFRQAYLLKAGDKLTEEKLIEMLDAETYLTAEQCVEFGLANEFSEVEADISQAKSLLEKAKENNLEQHSEKIKKLCANFEEIPSEPPTKTPAVNMADEFMKFFNGGK